MGFFDELKNKYQNYNKGTKQEQKALKYGLEIMKAYEEYDNSLLKEPDLDVIAEICNKYSVDKTDPRAIVNIYNFAYDTKKYQSNSTKITRKIRKGASKILGYKKILDTSLTGMDFYNNSNQLKQVEEEIKKISALPESEQDKGDLFELQEQQERLLVKIGSNAFSFMKVVPGVNAIMSEMIDLGDAILKTASNLIINHNNQIRKALLILDNEMNGKTLDDDNVEELLQGNKELLDAYNDFKYFKESGLLDLAENKQIKEEYSERIDEVDSLWTDLIHNIDKLNKKLVELAEEKRDNENIESVFHYSLEKGIKKIRDGNDVAKQSYDPLVIDLNNDGFDMNSKENGVYFDLDGNKLKEKTAWASDNDAILAIDINENGKIDNGAELLGDDYILEDGTRTKSALEALASFDKNGDGIINSNDEGYDKLLVWNDSNQNGISESDELKKLEDYNITAIHLSDKQSRNRNINGSKLKNIISYEKEVNGEIIIGKIGELLFDKDNIDVEDDDLIANDNSERASRIKILPNIRAFGNIRSLHNEMFLDESDTIIKLIEDFQNTTNLEERDEILDSIQDTIDEITEEIAQRIHQINERPPSAIFCIGGGCQIPRFVDSLAQKLDLPNERVAIKGVESLDGVRFEKNPLIGPEFITPLGIGYTKVIQHHQDFVQVLVNDLPVRLLNAKTLKVSDALIIAGFNARKLLSERGESFNVFINGEERRIAGAYGEPAKIWINGVPAGLGSEIKNQDRIVVEPATSGEQNKVKLQELIDLTASVRVGYKRINLIQLVRVNGTFQLGDYIVSPNDDIQYRVLKTAEDLAQVLQLSHAEGMFIRNGEKLLPDDIIKNKDKLLINKDALKYSENVSLQVNYSSALENRRGVDVKENIGNDDLQEVRNQVTTTEYHDTKYENMEYEDVEYEYSEQMDDGELEELVVRPRFDLVQTYDYVLVVNGKTIEITEFDREMVFVDVFNYIDFDLKTPKGIPKLILNGMPAKYTDKLKSGDVIEIGWKKL